MKKFLLTAFSAVAIMGGLASCSNEEPMPMPISDNQSEIPSVVADELTTVTFSGSMPKGVHSRGIETSINRLIAAVYDPSGNLILSETYTGSKLTSILSGGKFNVQFNLATINRYRVFFWADRIGDLECEVDLQNKTVSINDQKMTTLTDDWDDAYYVFMYDNPTEIEPAKQSTYNITLRRPFANIVLVSNQINDPQVACMFPGGAQTIFGATQEGTSNAWNSVVWKTYDFWDGTLNKHDDYKSAINLCDWANVGWNYYNVVNGYTTMLNQMIFVARDGSTFSGYFIIDDKWADEQTQDGGGYNRHRIGLGKREYKQNCRYIFKDDKNNGGGMFGSDTSFSVTVDSNWDDTSVNDL